MDSYVLPTQTAVAVQVWNVGREMLEQDRSKKDAQLYQRITRIQQTGVQVREVVQSDSGGPDSAVE